MQHLIVGSIVIACGVYAAWSLVPAAVRRRVAGVLLRQPMPARWAAFFRRHAAAASGCGCDGCDRSGKIAPAATSAQPAEPAVQPITFHPRRKPGPAP